MADEEEGDALQEEFDWVLNDEVHRVLEDVQSTLMECLHRFHMQLTEANNKVKPEKFLLYSPNGAHQIKCMVTLMGDSICEADIMLKINKQQQQQPHRSTIGSTSPWRIQQIQDAGNHLCQALELLRQRDSEYIFKTGQQVIKYLDGIMDSLTRGRTCLALPKRKTLEELIKNTNLKLFSPPFPNDIVLSFYIQAQKLVLAVYQLYLNQHQKLDIYARFQVECSVPWLNEALVLFTVALQMCQQLKDKVTVLMECLEELGNKKSLHQKSEGSQHRNPERSRGSFTIGDSEI